MSAAEAMQAMSTALTARHAGQLIVSTGNLDARIRQWVKLESLRTGAPPAPAHASRSRPTNGTGDPTSPDDEIEQLVSRAWQSVLGIDEIGVDESFLDLGGHSLLAMQIVARLRSLYHVDITLRDFFEAPTIARLSSFIREKMIQDIESLTDEEVRQFIANETHAHD